MSRCIIFANGILANPDSARRLIRADDRILAADGGTRHARTLGLIPSAIIGDLDSIPQEERRTLNYAVKMEYREIIIVAALGGRLDQTLGNLALLTNVQLSNLNVKLDDGVEETFFCRDQSHVEGRRGDLISLIPWGGEVRGVCTEGLRWPLLDETLYPHKTRGISNELLGEITSIKIETGLLLIVHRRLIIEN
jgi:thiamine pyrophosphokinase